jgi:hypothetical protein
MRIHTTARLVAAALVLAAGAIHLYLYFDYFNDVPTIGPLFVANAAAAVVIAIVLATWDHILSLLAGFGFSVATLGAFFISVENGLFGYHETLRGAWQERAGVVEAAAILLTAGLIAHRLLPGSTEPRAATRTNTLKTVD